MCDLLFSGRRSWKTELSIRMVALSARDIFSDAVSLKMIPGKCPKHTSWGMVVGMALGAVSGIVLGVALRVESQPTRWVSVANEMFFPHSLLCQARHQQKYCVPLLSRHF